MRFDGTEGFVRLDSAGYSSSAGMIGVSCDRFGMGVKRLTVIGCLVAFLATSSLVMASEEGRRNTRNVLGVATGVMALKGNTKAALVGAAATLVAQGQLDKSIRARHERQAYRRGYRVGHRRGVVAYRSNHRGHRAAYRVHKDNGRHLGWYKQARR